MARLPYYDPSKKDDEFNTYIGKLGGLNIFRMLAHSERTARGFVRLGNALLYRGALVFGNGDNVRMPQEARAALIGLADTRAALPWRSRSDAAARLVYEWYRAGYVELA